jgi:hypothetical protein
MSLLRPWKRPAFNFFFEEEEWLKAGLTDLTEGDLVFLVEFG